MLGVGLTASAQSKYGATPDDSIACISNVSLYQEFYKQKSYGDCYEPWRQIILHCPRFSKSIYQRGEKIMDAMIKSAATDEEREAYIQELMAMYDTRIANYGEEAKVLCMKAVALSEYKPKSVKEIYAIYDAAVKADVRGIDENYITLFFKTTVDYVQAGFADATLIIDNYDIAITRLEEIVEEVVEDTLKVQKISGYINNVDAVFSPYANCEQLVEIYQSKFNENPNDVVLLRKITDIMMKKGCTESQLFFAATENLYNLEPSPSTAMRMGTMCYGKKQYAKAVEYVQDAVKGLTEKKDLYRAYLTLGMSHNGLNNYSAARTALMKAAEIDRTKGEPYIALAQVYASSYRSIDDGMGGRSAYWAAVDECRRAKSVEPTEQIANVADRLIGIYAGYYPKKNDAFMLNLIDGNTYTVPGWIGKSTVIRTR